MMKTSSKMTKEKFCKILKTLQASNDLKRKINDLIFTEVDVESDFLSGYGMCVDHAGLCTELLDVIMDDEDDMVSWWCWEMDFGRECTEDSVMVNHKPVDVRTAEQLYDFLIGEQDE